MSAQAPELVDLDGPPETTVTSGNGNPVVPDTQSLLERAKRTQQKAAGNRQATITIPETGGILVARYRLLDPVDELEPITRQAIQQGGSENEKQLLVAMDVLIHACVGLYVRDVDGGGKLMPIDPDGSGPARYDTRFVAAYGFGGEYDRARDILRAVFNHNDIALFEHSQRLQKWMTDTSLAVDGELWQGE